MRDLLKSWPAARRLRLLNLEYRNTFKGLPRWRAVEGRNAPNWAEARKSATGAKVLLATNVGAQMAANTLDSTLAVALTLRGAQVNGLLCDSALPACLACETNWWPDHEHFLKHGPNRTLCGPCYRPAARMWDRLGLPIHRLGAGIDPTERDRCWALAHAVPLSEVDTLEHNGVRVGMHARSSVLRYFARGTLEAEPDAEPVRRRYLAAALMAATALEHLFAREAFDVCVAHHGIYVPQGVVTDVAHKHGTRLVTWNIAYRAGSFIFSHDDTYHFTLMTEPVETWRGLDLNDRMEHTLDDYMRARETGAKDWITYQDSAEQSIGELAGRYGIDFSKPTVTAFTNVLWDAQVFYQSNAFPNMLDWLFETIRYFRRRPDVHLIVRVHPAEVLNALTSRQTAMAELARVFPELPPNVTVIPPTDKANSYVLARHSNAAIIYGTKMGVELAYMGVPTIVAGESWARNKGLTFDAASREDYLRLLDAIPLAPMDQETRRNAAKYAFHFFFRRTIPLDFLTVQKGSWPPFRIDLDDLQPLMPGRSQGLDVICRGILEGTPFVFPAAELLAASEPSH